MKTFLNFFILIAVLSLVLVGCSGDSHVTVKQVGVTLAAQGVTAIDQGQQVALTATVTNDTANKGVSWAVTGTGCTGAACGTLTNTTTSAATYVAPSSVTGIQSVTVTATSIADTTKFASVTVSVAPPPAITMGSLPAATSGASYPATTLTESGGSGTLTWSVSAGSLPPGLSLNASTGVISGTPTTPGTYNFTLKVVDSGNPVQSATKDESIIVNAATLGISPATLASGVVSTAYNASLASTGGTGAVTWSLASGTLPAGLALNASTGAITGTPTAAGTVSFTVKATDSATPPQTATKALTITINSALAISTTTLTGGTVGAAYGSTLGATGGTGAVTWSISSGSLPAGLRLNASTGAITGTPTTAGTANFTVKATDSATPPATATQAISLTIAAASKLTVTTTSLDNGLVGAAYSTALGSSGGTGAVTWSLSAGTLPAGLTLDSQGTISGTPTTAGTSNFTVKATDSGTPAQTATKALTLLVNPATFSITTTTLPNGTVGTAYHQTLATTGGTGAVLWTLASGSSLPAGLALDNTTGVIGGTPSATGTTNFTVQAQDSSAPAQNASQALSLTITAGSSNNSPLNGQYTFVLGGYTSGNATIGGTFAADGAGNISNGVLDFNDPSTGPSTNVAFTGSYTLQSDHRGTLTLTATPVGTLTFAVALTVDNTGNATKGVLSSHDATTKHFSGELRKQDPSAFSLSAIAGSYAWGAMGRDANNVHAALAGVYTLASDGNITAGEWDFQFSAADIDLAFTGSATAATNGRGTMTLTNANGTFHFSYYPVSTTDQLLMSLDPVPAFPIVQGEMLQQSGRPFSSSSLNGDMIFYGQAEGPAPGASINVRAGTIKPEGTPGTFTMTYTGADGVTPAADSKFFTYSVSPSGRVTTTCTFTGATSVFYLAGPNSGFFVGGTITAADSTKKLGGRIEPQNGGPYSLASLSGDYVFVTLAPTINSANVSSAVVHLDGAGNATVTTDAKDSTASLSSGSASTWTLTQNGAGSPVFLIMSSTLDIYLITLQSPTRAVFVPQPSLVTAPNVFLMEK